MLMGWVLFAYLREVKCYLFSKRKFDFCFALISLVMVLSTSRMGILMMLLWLLLRFFMKQNSIIAKAKVVFFLSVFACVIAAYYGDAIMEYFEIFTVGLGILEGQSTHSSGQRIDDFLKVLHVFLDNPIVGVSLGGVDPHIASNEGVFYSTEHNGMGICVFAEILAASGIIGFLIFIAFFIQLFKKNWQLSLMLQTKESYLLKGMLWALLFEIMILQFNQNILRSYFWMHIAILTTLFAAYRKKFLHSYL
jgi:O-antigen ligase